MYLSPLTRRSHRKLKIVNCFGRPRMPLRIVEDVVRGTQYRVRRDVGSYTRMFYVTGLDATAPAAQRMADAAQATDSSTGNTIPAYGAAHPTIAAAFAAEIDV